MKTIITPRLGIDIGRVIVSAADERGRADTSFLSGSEAAALATPVAAGALTAIADLVHRLDGRVWLVSKCGARIAALTVRWLEHQSFFDRTGLLRDHVRFCRERAEKRVHAEALGLTHFVDDRVDVLGHLRGVVPHLYLFGHQAPGVTTPPGASAVRDWEAAHAALARDLEVSGRHVRDEPDAVR